MTLHKWKSRLLRYNIIIEESGDSIVVIRSMLHWERNCVEFSNYDMVEYLSS